MRTKTVLATVVLVFTLAGLPAGAAQNIPLQRIAAAAGYQYHWSPIGTALVLSRPGMSVVLWPGEQRYQVNDHVEVADSAPSFSHGDLYVSSALAARLESLARRTTGYAGAAAPSVPYERTGRGAITLTAHNLPGSEAVDVQGTAPAGAPVTITLLALVSSDVPTILVSRHDVVSDVNGRFGAVIPIASAYERGTVLRILATSITGVASAQAELTTGAPNAGVTVPLETAH